MICINQREVNLLYHNRDRMKMIEHIELWILNYRNLQNILKGKLSLVVKDNIWAKTIKVTLISVSSQQDYHLGIQINNNNIRNKNNISSRIMINQSLNSLLVQNKILYLKIEQCHQVVVIHHKWWKKWEIWEVQ